MGCQMPIVCKEVHLPFVYGESISFDEYKNKYGLDLHDYLKVDAYGNINLKEQDSFVKIFIALDSSSLGYGKIVEPINFFSGVTKKYIAVSQVINADGEISSAFLIGYDPDSEKFSVEEM